MKEANTVDQPEDTAGGDIADAVFETERKPERSRFSPRRMDVILKLSFWVVVMAVLAALGAVEGVMVQGYQIQDRLVRNWLEPLALGLARGVEAETRGPVETVLALNRTLVSLGHGRDGLEAYENELKATLQSRPRLHGAWLVCAAKGDGGSGTWRHWVRNGETLRQGTLPTLDMPKPFLDRLTIDTAGKAAISPPFTREGSATRLLSVAVPVALRDGMLCLTGVDLPLAALHAIVGDDKLAGTVRTAVLANNGVWIDHFLEGQIGRPISEINSEHLVAVDAVRSGEAVTVRGRMDGSGEPVLRMFQPFTPGPGMAPWSVVLSLPLTPVHAAIDELRQISLLAMGGVGGVLVLTVLVAGHWLVSRRLGQVTATLRRIGGPDLEPDAKIADGDNIGRVEGVAYALAARLHGWTSGTLSLLDGVGKVMDSGQQSVERLTQGFDVRIRETVELFDAVEANTQAVYQTLPRIGELAVSIDGCARRFEDEQPAVKAVAGTARAAAASGQRAMGLANSLGRISRLAKMLATKADSLQASVSDPRQREVVVALIVDMRKLSAATLELGRDVTAIASDMYRTSAAVAVEGDRVEAVLGDIARHLHQDNALFCQLGDELNELTQVLHELLGRAKGVARHDEEMRDEAMALLVAGRQLHELVQQVRKAADSLS